MVSSQKVIPMEMPSELRGEKFKDPGPKKGRFHNGMAVQRFGCATGQITANIPDSRETINLNSAGTKKGGLTQRPESVEVSEEEIAYTQSGKKFCEKGDSGSWVFDDEARLVGILWGEYQYPCWVVFIVLYVIRKVVLYKYLTL